MTSREFKDVVYGEFARLGKALSSPRRLEILDLLCQGPRTVESLARETGQSGANTSHHLSVLREARLVEVRRRGTYATYRLGGEEVCRLFGSIRQLSESRLAEVERVTREYFDARGSMEPIDIAQLRQRVRAGEVTLLDVRPVSEYRAGHIPGALSVPLDEIEDRLAELPRESTIVAYCRGPYCVLAHEAAERLTAHGFKAVRLADGVPDWRERGFPVSVALEG